MKNSIIIAALTLVCSNIHGQTIESKLSGISSYYHSAKEAEKASGVESENVSIIPLSLNVNTKGKQIDVRNSYLIPLNGKSETKKVDVDLNIGFSIGGKIDNSIASVFKDNNVIGGFKSGGLISLRFQQTSKVFESDEKLISLFKEYHNAKAGSKEKRNLKKSVVNYVSQNLHNATYWLYLSPGFEGRKFINIDSLNQTSYIKKNNTINNVSFGISTFQNNLPFEFMGLFDLSINFKNQDNFSDLQEVSSFNQFSNGNLGNKQSFTSYLGNYKESVKSKQVSFESYLVNKNLPLFGLYLNPTYDFAYDLYNPSLDLNYTIYFLSPKVSVLTPNFGVVFSHKDITGNRDELFENEKSRFSIGIVTRLNVGEWFN